MPGFDASRELETRIYFYIVIYSAWNTNIYCLDSIRYSSSMGPSRQINQSDLGFGVNFPNFAPQYRGIIHNKKWWHNRKIEVNMQLNKKYPKSWNDLILMISFNTQDLRYNSVKLRYKREAFIKKKDDICHLRRRGGTKFFNISSF